MLKGLLKKAPKYLIFGGQRRTYALPFCVTLRDLMGVENALKVAVTVRQPSSFAELQEMILLENSREGQRAYSPVSVLQNACRVFDADPLIGETKLGRIIGLHDQRDKNGDVTKNQRGRRQFAIGFATLNAQNRPVRLRDRIALPRTTDDEGKLQYVPEGYVDHRKLQSQAVRFLCGNGTDKGTFPPDVSFVYGGEEQRPCSDKELEAYVERTHTHGSERVNYTWQEVEKMAKLSQVKNRTVQAGELMLALAGKAKKEWQPYLSWLLDLNASDTPPATPLNPADAADAADAAE
jgi:hypothetical protein